MQKFIATIVAVLALLAIGQAQDNGEDVTTLAPDENNNSKEEQPPPPPPELDLYIPLRPPRLPGIGKPFGPLRPPNSLGNIFGPLKFNEERPQYGPLRRPQGQQQQQQQGFQQRPFGFALAPRQQTQAVTNNRFVPTQFERFYVNDEFEPGHTYGNGNGYTGQQQRQGPPGYLDNRSFQQQQQRPLGALGNPFGLSQFNNGFEGFDQGVYGYRHGRYPYYV